MRAHYIEKSILGLGQGYIKIRSWLGKGAITLPVLFPKRCRMS